MRVIELTGETYQVVTESDCGKFDHVVYQGRLSDCLAYIELTEKGYL